MHLGSYSKMSYFVNKYLDSLKSQKLRILDVGSQDINGSYKPLFISSYWEYVGCDMTPGKNVDIVLKSTYCWDEIETGFFDVLVSGQTFEHAEFFWVTIMEMMRVMKEGGLCCIIAPSGGFEHRYPVDCWRFYPDGFKAIARYAGLETLEAFTEWINVQYPDGSGFWKDSVLIARKPVMTDEQRNSFEKRNALSRQLIEGL